MAAVHRFFERKSQSSIALLLHNGNKYATVPVAHSTVIKESYESSRHTQMDCLWVLQIDTFFGRFTVGKYKVSLLYLKHSLARDKHWTKKEWSSRLKWKAESYNVSHENFVDLKRIVIYTFKTQKRIFIHFHEKKNGSAWNLTHELLTKNISQTIQNFRILLRGSLN